MAASNDRNSCTKAIAALERALHAGTGETEVVAAVHAFRRISKGRMLSDVCEVVFDKRTSDGMTLAEFQQDWQDKLVKQQTHIANLVGEINETKRQLAAAQIACAMIAAEKQKIERQVGKITNLPAVYDPAAASAEDGKKKKPTQLPLQHTDLVAAEFDGERWEDISWNQVRTNVAAKLLASGVAIEDLNKVMKGVCLGERTDKGFKFVSEFGFSIKNQNTTEICRELEAASIAYAGRKMLVHARARDKSKRDTGKAGGKFSRESAFPGFDMILMPSPPDEATT